MAKKPGDEGYWEMPEWMEPYREIVEGGGGGNSAERLMNLESEDTRPNIILGGLAVDCGARVNTRRRLRAEGALRMTHPTPVEAT